MGMSQEERELLNKANEIRRKLRDTYKEINSPYITQEDVDQLNEFAMEFESRFLNYNHIKEFREEEERVANYKINAESAEQLKQLYNELDKVNGAFDAFFDYNEDTELIEAMIENMNEYLSVSKMVENMRAFIKLVENK